MTDPVKIAVLVSGGGTNLQAIIDGIEQKTITNTEIAVVISNNPGAYALERAKKHGIEAVCISPKEYESRAAFNEDFLRRLDAYEVDLVVLAGFLVRVPDLLLHAYPGKIINIHPALLPKFGGKGMYGDKVHEAVVAAGEKESGITIHYINEHYDEGSIIFQATCPVLPDDSPEEVAKKVHALEYEHFPRIVEEILG